MFSDYLQDQISISSTHTIILVPRASYLHTREKVFANKNLIIKNKFISWKTLN